MPSEKKTTYKNQKLYQNERTPEPYRENMLKRREWVTAGIERELNIRREGKGSEGEMERGKIEVTHRRF